jgi:hypothetical protein
MTKLISWPVQLAQRWVHCGVALVGRSLVACLLLATSLAKLSKLRSGQLLQTNLHLQGGLLQRLPASSAVSMQFGRMAGQSVGACD